MESFAGSHFLKISRWLQLGTEEGQVEQWYLVIPHTVVHFMSPWFVPSYTPTRNGSVDSIPTLGSHSGSVIHESVARSHTFRCDRENILDGKQPARILYPAPSMLHFESSLVSPPQVPSKENY